MSILVPLGKIIVAIPEPWIKSTRPDIVLRLDLTNNKLEKYFFYPKGLCVLWHNFQDMYASTLDVVWCIKVWEISMYLQV